jgi:hypothetical protein
MAARTRRRRILRWIVRGVLVVVGLALALAIAAVIAVHTSWGRDVMRRRLVAALGEVFRGRVAIGDLEGSPFGTLIARDVVIDDPAGRPVIAIDRVAVRVHLWALARHELHVSELDASGVQVFARQEADGSIDLARLTRPQAPRRWSIAIEDARIRGGALDARIGGRPLHLDDVEVDGAVSFPERGPLVVRAAAHARWRERGLPLAATAEVHMDGDRLQVPHAQAALGELSLVVSSLALERGRVTGVVLASASPSAVRAVAPDAPLAGHVLLAARLAPVDGDERRIAVSVGGIAGGAPIAGGAVLDPRGRRATIALDALGVDGAAIARGAPRSAIDVRAVADVTARPGATGLAAIDANVLVTAAGRVRDIRVDGLAVAVAAHHGAIDASVHAVGPGAAALSIAARLAISGGPAPSIELRDAAIVGRAGAIDQAVPGIAARGAIAFDARASGHLAPGAPALAVAGRVTGDGVEAGGVAARRAAVELDGGGLPARPSGRLHVELDGIARDGQPLLDVLVADARSRADGRIDVRTRSGPTGGAWRADLDAIIELGADRVAIALGDHRVRTGGLSWAGRGGTVTIDARAIAVRGLSSRVAGGRVAVDGALPRDGPDAGDLSARVEIADVDLAAIDRALGAGAIARGTAGGEASITRTRGVVRARLDAHAREVIARANAPPLAGELHATLAPRELALTARVTGDHAGAVALDVEIAAPRRADDLRAWRALGAAALRRADVTVTRVDAASLAPVLGAGAPTAGRVDGALSLAGGVARGELAVHELAVPGLPGPLDGSLAVSTDARGAVVELDARARNRLAVRAELRGAVPARPLDPRAWAALGPAGVDRARVHVDADLGDATIAAWLGAIEPSGGHLALDGDVGRGARIFAARVALTGFTGRAVAEPIDGALVLTAGPDGVFGRGTATHDGRPLASVQLGSPRAPAALAAALRTPGALRDVPIHARLTADRVAIASLLRVAGRADEGVQGTAAIDATAEGTLGDPVAHVRASVAHLGGGDGAADVQLTARYRGALVELDATGAEPGGGALAITARVPLDHVEQATAHVIAHGFELAPIARLAPESIGFAGALDADLQLGAGAAGGRLHLARAELPLHPQLGTLRAGELTVTLDRGALAVDARGEVGRGTIEVHGRGELAGLLPTTASADVALRAITLLDVTQPTVDGDVRVELRRDGDRWRADAAVRHGVVAIPDDDGRALLPRDAPDDLVIVRGGEPPPPPRVVAIGRRPEHPVLLASLDLGQVRIESSTMRGWVHGKLTAAVGTDALAVEGAIEAGTADVTVADRRYRLDRASVRFDGGFDPLVDIHLSHDFRDVALYVSITGRLSEPVLHLTSDRPSYSESELVRFFMGGEPGRTATGGFSDVAGSVVSAMFSSKVKSAARRWGFALDVVRISPSTSATATALSVGKWLTRRLYVEYRQRVDARYDENQSEAEAEYWLARHFVLNGTAGDRGVVGFDLVWTRRW